MRKMQLVLLTPPHYMLMHQFARVARERMCLKHDDRLDALSMAVAFWVKAMAQDTDDQMRKVEDAEFLRELEEFMSDVGSKVPSGRRRGILKRRL